MNSKYSMMTQHRIPSLNDLTLDIVRVSKKCGIDSCLIEMAELYRAYGANINTVEDMKKALQDPVLMFEIVGSMGLSSYQIRDLGGKIAEIRKTKKYQDWAKRCEALRDAFTESRTDYFHNLYEYYKDDGGGKLKKVEIDKYNIGEDVALGTWLAGLLKNAAPGKVHVKYETDGGKIVEDDFAHRPDRITEDFVETSPIDRWSGVTIFDRFYIRSFWSATKHKWVAIAPHLIINVYTQDMIDAEEDAEDLDDDDGPFGKDEDD